MQCCLQRQRLDQWHFPLGSSQAVEMIDNYGTQYTSVQLVAKVMNIIKKGKKVVIVNCSIGHGRVWTCLP